MSTVDVHVAVFDTLADWEIGYLTAHLRNGQYQREPGRYRVVTVGLTAEPVITMGGVRIVPDTTLAEVTPDVSAMLVLPGGETWDSDSLTPLVETARRFLDAGVPVAAICGATFALAVAGLLDTRPHTSNAAEFLQSSGYAGTAHYRTDPAVTDGDLITASGVRPIDFAREIFARLDVYEPKVLDAWYRVYADADPAAYYELAAT